MSGETPEVRSDKRKPGQTDRQTVIDRNAQNLKKWPAAADVEQTTITIRAPVGANKDINM